MLEDGSVGEAACRANLTARNASCYLEVCEQCTSQCTYPTAKAVAGVLKCTVAREQLAFVHCKFYASNPPLSLSHCYTRIIAYTLDLYSATSGVITMSRMLTTTCSVWQVFKPLTLVN